MLRNHAVVCVLCFVVFRSGNDTEVSLARSHVGNVVKAHPEEQTVSAFKQLAVVCVVGIGDGVVVHEPFLIHHFNNLCGGVYVSFRAECESERACVVMCNESGAGAEVEA